MIKSWALLGSASEKLSKIAGYIIGSGYNTPKNLHNKEDEFINFFFFPIYSACPYLA